MKKKARRSLPIPAKDREPQTRLPEAAIGGTRVSRCAFLLACTLISLAGWWWATSGDFRVSEPVGFDGVYEAQARSLLDGRTDVDCGIASGEAFVRDGKCYVYFGPVPGLIRLPMMWMAPGLDGRWGRPMVWVAGLLFLMVVGLILTEAGHALGTWTSTFYLLLAAFGSTISYMWSWPSTYTEAIMWAVAFAAASLYSLLRWSRHGGATWIVGACLLAILAFFSRISTGAGPMLAVGLMALTGFRRRKPGRRAEAAVTLLLLGLAAHAYVALNYSRMGTYLNSVPVHLHVQYNPARLAHIDGTLFHPEKGLSILLEYLFQYPRFRSTYPWLGYRQYPLLDLGRMDLVDLHVGVLAMMPALAWLAWAGWRGSQDKRVRWILLSPVIGLALLATVAAINHRYVHEFILLLVPAGAFGLRWALASGVRRWITIVLTAWSVYACWALALVGQRELMPWVNDESRDRHRATGYRIDQWLSGNPGGTIQYDYMTGAIAPPPVPGVRVRIVQTGSVYEFDGSRWRLRAGPPAHRFRVRIRFAELPEGTLRLLVAGKPPNSDLVLLERTATGRYRVGMDHPGSGVWGPEFELAAQRDYLFECELDRLNREMLVKLEGVVVGQRKTVLIPWVESDVTAGAPGELLPAR